jgi:hypothetical protein
MRIPGSTWSPTGRAADVANVKLRLGVGLDGCAVGRVLLPRQAGPHMRPARRRELVRVYVHVQLRVGSMVRAVRRQTKQRAARNEPGGR